MVTALHVHNDTYALRDSEGNMLGLFRASTILGRYGDDVIWITRPVIFNPI